VPLERTSKLMAHADYEEVESSIDLKRLMAQLPPKMRRAIQLVKLNGLRTSEAAQQSKMTKSAVKISIHRGMKAVSAAIKPEGKS